MARHGVGRWRQSWRTSLPATFAPTTGLAGSALYLATMGGKEKPAPTSVFKVKGVDWNPLYPDYQNLPAAESGPALSHFGWEAAP